MVLRPQRVDITRQSKGSSWGAGEGFNLDEMISRPTSRYSSSIPHLPEHQSLVRICNGSIDQILHDLIESNDCIRNLTVWSLEQHLWSCFKTKGQKKNIVYCYGVKCQENQADRDEMKKVLSSLLFIHLNEDNMSG